MMVRLGPRIAAARATLGRQPEPVMTRTLLALALLTSCGQTDTACDGPCDNGTDTGGETDADSGTDVDGDTELEPLDLNTDEALAIFYDAQGGQDAFPDHYISALETLLYAHDDVAAGDYDSANDRVSALLIDYPLSTDIWRQESGFAGLNVGDPIAYYGLRMLEQIIEAGPQAETGTLRMTAVVALCASVTRPTLPNLEPETVTLDIDPELVADNYRALYVSTDLFRRWVTAITGGMTVELVVHEMSTCATVDYTDDGNTIVSYPDAQAMVSSTPSNITNSTDFWWVVAPSGVPGDGSGYDRHFITGGMGAIGAALPLFLSDDGWFMRKPEHLGNGRYSEIERRAYQPQWFQHEFMHHLFRTWPEFGLEDASHQWFNRSTWPDDFEGRWEPDYYSEAVNKRFLAATPSLAEALNAPDIADFDTLDLDLLAGDYERLPVANDYHEVTLSVQSTTEARWTNAANVSWSLQVRDGALWTGPDCPYGEVRVGAGLDASGAITSVSFNGEIYTRLD
jgi:hypothetical protein